MATTYTYDPNESTAKDRVRGLCGDTDARWADPAERVSDEFIAGLLAGNGGDELAAAIECARRRMTAVAGQKGEAPMAPGLEPNRRFERLRQVYDSLLARASGRESASVPDMGTLNAVLANSVTLTRLGSLDEREAVTL